MSTLAFYAQFVTSKVGTDGLTVTWDVEQITRSDGTRSALVTGGATSITIGRRGLYGYLLASADTKLYDYIATAITATTTVDQQEIAALWTVYEADAVKVAGATAVVPPTASDNATAAAAAILVTPANKLATDASGNASANVTLWADGALPEFALEATVQAILEDTGTTLLALIAANGLGAGAIPFTYTLTSSGDGSPIADADVWVTSDSAGSNLLASGRTDQNGVVTFYLDSGTVYVWRQKSGWDFTNPDTEVVS